MRIVWIALVVAAVSMPRAAMAAWNIYCRNDRIVIDQRPLSQMRSGRDDSKICVIGPSFEFGPDARTRVETTLRKKEGDSCTCR